MNRINTTLVIVLVILVCAKSVFAEVLRWPQGCASGQLEVTNSTTEEVRGWLQKFKPTLTSEVGYAFPPESVTKIALKAKSSERFSLMHLSRPSSLKTNFLCKSKSYSAHSFEGGILTFRRTDLSAHALWIQNLAPEQNLIQIQYLDRKLKVISESSLKINSLQKTVLKFSEKAWFYVRVQGLNRFAAFHLTATGSDGPIFIASQPSQNVTDAAAYFEVRSRDNIGDSFVAKITNPDLIAQARLQISNPNLEKILFAKIAKGHAGFNRNWSKTEKPFWSWSVTEVTSINDLASTSCNGLPQAVEDRVDHWVNSPGRICFWSYRIRKELKPSEIAAGESIE